ncbi:hypothetical protein A4U64_03375 [Rhodococcus sp. WB1]|nr:hypothetical protein A4U64_03375 [Rhodococcus sp. WB1]
MLTWCSVERAIARRLLPAAAILIGAITVTAGPSGIICFAALIAGARPIAPHPPSPARNMGWLPLLAPMVAAGLVVLVPVFSDQTPAAVLEMQPAHEVGPNVPWFQEYLRYQYLLQITVDGSLARRFAVFTLVLCLLVAIVAMLAAVATGPAVLRSRRNRALFAAAVSFVVTMSFIGPNGWWYVSSYGVPWWDKPPSIAEFGFSTVVFAATVVALLWLMRPRTMRRSRPCAIRSGLSESDSARS